MNKETIRNNLKGFFLKAEEATKATSLKGKVDKAEKEAYKNVQDARSFIRKAIGKEEVYIADVKGKDYKITSDADNDWNVLIEEINIIK